MPQSLAKLLVHLVFSTKDRAPFLRERAIRIQMHQDMGGILSRLDCKPLSIGGVDDHVHALFTLSRTQVLADVVKEAKRASSVWVKRKSPELAAFSWQSGYGAFSVGFSQIEAVCAYIENQEEHHRKRSFQDELRELLARYEMEYDERYLWD